MFTYDSIHYVFLAIILQWCALLRISFSGDTGYFYVSLIVILSLITSLRWCLQVSVLYNYNFKNLKWIQSIQLLSCVRLFATSWTAAFLASLSITNSLSPPKLMPIELVMQSNHLILCRPLLFLPSIFPNIRVFSIESALCVRWPRYWSFSSTSFLPINTQDWSPLGWTGWISLQSKGLSRVFSNTTVQKHQFFSTRPL